MNLDSSLLIDQPWLVLVACYICLLAALTAIVMVGSLVAYALGFGKDDTYGLFVRMLVGLIGTSIVYALLKTGGQTSLVPIVIFSVATWWMHSRHSGFHRIDLKKLINSKQLFFLFGATTTLFFLFLTLVINLKTGELRFLGAGESAQFIDFPFTVRAGQSLNLWGIESMSTNFFESSQLGPKPYHWLEIWFAALVYLVFPINAEVLWSCVVNPVLFTVLLVGVAGFLERIVGEKPWLNFGSILILFISGFGILYPSGIEFFSATVRAESLLETPKYAIAYLFAIPVAEAVYNRRFHLLPYLFVLFGLSYLPIIPVGSMMAFAALVLHLWSIRADRPKAIEHLVAWGVAYLLLAGWFLYFYSNSQISYSEGSGTSTGVLSTFDPVLSTKVFVHMLIQVFLTNIPYLLILLAIVFGMKAEKIKSLISENGNSLILLAAFYPVSVLGYVIIYGMTNSVQVWTVSYQSLHYVMLVGLIVCGLYHSKIVAKVISGLVLVAAVSLNFHLDLGAGNEMTKNEMTSINEFILAKGDENPQFVYIGDARYGNDGAGGLFDLVTDIFYPCRELGILTSPYANASLSVFEIPLSNDAKQRRKQKIILGEGPFYQYVAKQVAPSKLTVQEIAEFKIEFIKEFEVDFIIVPFDQELSTELIPLVGEHIEVRDGKLYEVL